MQESSHDSLTDGFEEESDDTKSSLRDEKYAWSISSASVSSVSDHCLWDISNPFFLVAARSFGAQKISVTLAYRRYGPRKPYRRPNDAEWIAAWSYQTTGKQKRALELGLSPRKDRSSSVAVGVWLGDCR